jgi:hypothetical protein
MKLEEIFNHWEEDASIDDSNLSNESLKTVKLHHKYLKMLTVENILFTKLDGEYKKLLKAKSEYFMGTLDLDSMKEYNWHPNPKLILKSDLPLHLDADNDIQEYVRRLALQKEKIKVLTSIIDAVMKRTFIIKNSIDNTKVMNGIN